MPTGRHSNDTLHRSLRLGGVEVETGVHLVHAADSPAHPYDFACWVRHWIWRRTQRISGCLSLPPPTGTQNHASESPSAWGCDSLTVGILMSLKRSLE